MNYFERKENGWEYNEDEIMSYARKNSHKYSSFGQMCSELGAKNYPYPVEKMSKKYRKEIEELNWNYDRHNPKFKAVYQSYDWMYNKFIEEGLTISQIALECNATERVIQKWLHEKHKLTNNDRRYGYKFNDIESSILIGSLLGDGHIDKRENLPIFIVSHAENQKDYLYWKYEIFKKYCNIKPTIKTNETIYRNGKEYKCQNSYRMCTRSIDDLKRFRELSTIELLDRLDELSLSIWLLDDGSRLQSNWSLCIARFSKYEKDYALKILNDKFDLDAYIRANDDRYINFRATGTRKLDSIILNNIPNDLDIIKYKLIDNEKITKPSNYRMVDNKIGLAKFCKINKLNYEKCKELFDKGCQSSVELKKEG